LHIRGGVSFIGGVASAEKQILGAPQDDIKTQPLVFPVDGASSLISATVQQALKR
jgi:hypothetical protein